MTIPYGEFTAIVYAGVNIFELFADTWTRKTQQIWVYQVEWRLYWDTPLLKAI